MPEYKTTIGPDEDTSGSAVRKVPALTIVSHPSMTRAGERLVIEDSPLEISRVLPEFGRRGQSARRPLEDQHVSRKSFVLLTREGGGVQLRLGQHATPVSVMGQPLSGDLELPVEQLDKGVPIVLSKSVVLLLHRVEQGKQWPDDDLGMVGESDAIHRVRERIRNVADRPDSVLIRGETGAGKELVARALHDRSQRKGLFVSHNVSSIPEGLATAELFGAKRGAFAELKVDRKGLFREANGGTLFLDEVGDALPQVQATLLRALEDSQVAPLGTEERVKVDVRFIAATDVDIRAKSQTGQFRAPLVNRLEGYPIDIPPLRERLEDIGLLFAYFAKQALEAQSETFRLEAQTLDAAAWLPADLTVLLLGYHWPGNARELRNVTRQLVIDNRGQSKLKADEKLLERLRSRQYPEPDRGPSGHREYSREELHEALVASDFIIKAAAESLGLERSTFQYQLKRLGIPTAVDLTIDQIKRAYQDCGGNLERMSKQLKVSRHALKSSLRTLGLEPGE